MNKIVDGKIRGSSLNAFMRLVNSGKMAKQEQVIFDYLKRHGEPLTLQEIAKVTGFGINSVSGRVHGLKKKRILQECQKRKCHLTKRMVTPVFIAGVMNE